MNETETEDKRGVVESKEEPEVPSVATKEEDIGSEPVVEDEESDYDSDDGIIIKKKPIKKAKK